MSATTVSDYLVERLIDVGVERIYAVVGDSLNPVTDSVRRSDGKLDWVHVRHEEAGAFAAGAEAQITGNLAVCAGSAGPGNLHLINGLYDAHGSGAPVLAIASHINTEEIGSEFHQETHPTEVFKECSHWCELVATAAQLPRALHIAIQTAIVKRGVSVLVLPGDVAGDTLPGDGWRSHIAVTRPITRPAEPDLERFAELLDASSKPVIFAGAGAGEARDFVLELADKVNAPVAYSFRGKDHFQANNEFDAGMSGLLGFGAAYKAMHEADLLLLLGTDFPYRDFLPSEVKVVQLDILGERLGRRVPLELGLIGDVAETIKHLLPLVTAKSDDSFLRSQRKHHERDVEKLQVYVEHVTKQHPIHPEYVAATLDRLAADDAIFTLDTGMTTVWGARYLHGSGKRRIIGSFKHGSMANAMPQAIGAQSAQPERQVISMSGDGGLTMLLGDLLTLHQEELPIKVVVFNNGVLGMVRLEMQVAGLPDFKTELRQVDFAALAESVGIRGIRIERHDEVEAGLREALATDGPVLCDVATDPEALSMPPHVTWEQFSGFATTAVKKALNGNIDEVWEQAKTNIRNVPRP
ncbi:pyruvate dehydrogenase [soil metagenome]